MPTYVPPKRGVEYIFYASLDSVANAGKFQVNPTIAAGDFRVSKGGGTLSNLTTLPAVTPAGSRFVKFVVSAVEMDDDIVLVDGSDASGNEWKDISFVIFTAARQIDDLATATALATVATYVDTEVAAIKAKTDNLPADPADASDIASVLTTIAGYVDTEVAAIKAKTDNLPADPASASVIASSLTTIANYIDTEVAAILDAVDTEVAAIKAKTDNLPSDPADASDVAAAISAAVAPLATATVLATVAGYIDTEVAAIKAKTDLIPAAPAAVGDIPTVEEIDTQLSDTHGDGSWEGGSGGGATPGVEFTYTVIDTSSNPIAGASVWFCTTSARTSYVWFGVTDAFGVARDAAGAKPTLDAGTYYLLVRRPGYSFGNDIEVVS